MKRQLVSKTKTKLSVSRQCNLLKINRSELYYKPQPIKTENMKVMKLIDNEMVVNHNRIRRLMKLMDIKAIYPQRNQTKIARGEYKFPYLLRNVVATKPNQVWSVDITYIAMANGFMYLTAIIDVYSRFIVGWRVGNSLDAEVELAREVEPQVCVAHFLKRRHSPSVTCTLSAYRYETLLEVDMLSETAC